jgi:hypothetical protein
VQDEYSITDSSHLHGSIAFLRVWNDMELQQDDVEQLYDGREIRPPQRQCPTGRYTSDVCVDFCPAGTFADADSAACVKCFPGKANPDSHATASDACVSCAAGETSELGAASCTPCPAGTFSYMVGACTECAAGRYSNAVGATSSTSCQQVRLCRSEAGEGKLTRTNSFALQCGVGKASATLAATSAIVCTECASGTYANAAIGATECVDCAAGSYSTVGVASCEQVRFEPGRSERKRRFCCLC